MVCLAHSALAEVQSRQPPSRHNHRILGLPVGPIRMTYAGVVMHRVFLMPVTTGTHASWVNYVATLATYAILTPKVSYSLFAKEIPVEKYVHSGIEKFPVLRCEFVWES